MLPLTSRTVPDNVVVDPPDDAGATGSGAMAGAAVDGGTLRSVTGGGAPVGLAIAGVAAVADTLLPGDAVVGAVLDAVLPGDAADGSTIAICAGRETRDGRSRTTAITATPRTATAAVQVQRCHNQTDIDG